jgi:hypothetical protein
MVAGGQRHTSAGLPLGKRPVPIVYKAWGAHGPSGHVRKNFDPWTLQSVESCYTD